MLRLIVAISLLIGATAGTATGCYDKSATCTKNTCAKFPEFSRNNCAKTCGFCGASISGPGGSTSLHGSLRSSSSNLDACYDKDPDCTQEVCRNYPYTAKERCPKFCGLCQSSSSLASSGSISSTSRITESSVIRKGNGGLCSDKDFDCNMEICRDYPYTAKERCAKTCGFCSPDSGASSTSSGSSATASGGISPSRHASIRTNEPAGIGSSSRHSSIRGSHDPSDSSPPYSTLSRAKEVECIDLDFDCTQQTCKDYPYTAKERCAKTCGFCRKEVAGPGGAASGRHSSLSDTQRSSTGFQSSTGSRRGSESSSLAGGRTQECRDTDPKCSEQSCLDRPYTARTKCAKTCGFCDGGDQRGSLVDLKSPSIDDSDAGSVITLDNDDTGTVQGGTRPSTAMSGHSVVSGGRSALTTHESRKPLAGGSSTTDSIRRPSSSSIRIQSTRPPAGIKTRYPGRTGPCTDENAYCEKGDCYKYPYFAQRYCEKTCGYC